MALPRYPSDAISASPSGGLYVTIFWVISRCAPHWGCDTTAAAGLNLE